MLYRYNLKVGFNGQEVFDGNFASINQLIKFACFFDDRCVMEAFDTVFYKGIPIYSLMKEFINDCRGI